MKLTAAVTHEQGVDFTVVLVKLSALAQPESAKNTLAASYWLMFPAPTSSCALRTVRGSVSHWGRPDIVRFCSNIFFEQLPWADYTSTAA